MKKKSSKFTQYMIYGSVMGVLSLGVCERMGGKQQPDREQRYERALSQIPALRNDFMEECRNASLKPDADFSRLYRIVEQRDSLYRSIGQKVNERWTCRAVTQNGERTGEYKPHFEYVQQ